MLVRALIWNLLSPSSGMAAADSSAVPISDVLFVPQFGSSAIESNWDTSSLIHLTPAPSRTFEGLAESERISTLSQLKMPPGTFLGSGLSSSSVAAGGSAPMMGSSLRYSSPSYMYLRRTSAMYLSASSSERSSYVFSGPSLNPMSSSSSYASSDSPESAASTEASGASASAAYGETASVPGAPASTNRLPAASALPSLQSFAMASLTITCDASGNAINSRSSAQEPPFASSSSSI